MPSPGIYTVAPTPFDEDGAIDLASVTTLTEWLVELGVHGMLVLGVLGEAHKLLDDERHAVLDRFVAAADGRVAIVAGTSHPSAVGTRELTKRAAAAGADAVMVSPPRLARPSEAAVRRFYEIVAADADIEVVIQDHPASSGVYMTAELIADLAATIPGLRSLKLEDPPTGPKIGAVRAAGPDDLTIFGGLGGVALVEELDQGAVGAMTGFAFPEVLLEIWQLHSDGQRDAAQQVFERHAPLLHFEAQPFVSLPIRKRVYRMRGAITTDHVRAPAPTLDPGTIATLETLIDDVGLKLGSGS